MANKDIFFKAIFLRPPLICGKQLRPFSLAHEYFLEYVQNPYLVGGKTSKEKLLEAILVCSMTYSEIAEYICKPKVLNVAIWALRWRMHNLKVAGESFLVYLDDYFDTPEHWIKENSSGEGYASPWQYHIVRILCDKYNCTLDDAWNMPVNLARCYYDVHCESGGDESIISDHQQSLIEEGKNYGSI
jgi:hypothetical protein